MKKSSEQQSKANEKVRIFFQSKTKKKKKKMKTKEKDLGVWGTKYCTQISSCTRQILCNRRSIDLKGRPEYVINFVILLDSDNKETQTIGYFQLNNGCTILNYGYYFLFQAKDLRYHPVRLAAHWQYLLYLHASSRNV